MMVMKLCREIKNGQVEGFALVREAEVKTSNKGSTYMDMLLGDCYGEIRAKIWDYKKEGHGAYGAGDIVKVRGRLSMWQNQPQLTIDLIRRTKDEDDVAVEELVPSAPRPAGEMYDEVTGCVESFKDRDIKRLTLHLLETHRERLMVQPAALRLHHAMRSGLLYHITTMLKLAACVLEVYPQLNGDLVNAGIILHDIGKMRELETDSSGIVTGYTACGALIGHVVGGAMEVAAACEELGIPQEKSMVMQHMLLSHHGVAEFGSPQPPKFLEAEVLSQLDLLDARMFEMHEALCGTAAGDFTQPIWSLDKRRLYNHGMSNDD